jgi:hypothetical protein
MRGCERRMMTRKLARMVDGIGLRTVFAVLLDASLLPRSFLPPSLPGARYLSMLFTLHHVS